MSARPGTASGRLAALLALVLLGLPTPVPARDSVAKDSVWEINGIRLEADQVERLAEDMAERTLDAVTESVPDLGLDAEQRQRMLQVYRDVSLETYREIVDVVNREDLDEAAKDERVRALALRGEERSRELMSTVLRPPQLVLYATWAEAQIEAYMSERSDRRRHRRRR